MKTIPYGRQFVDKQDVASIVSVLESDWITQGPKISEFEEALAEYCGAKYAVAVSSGTAALHLACLVAGLEKSDEVITSPITFLATANSILYTGAKPVFADVDYDTVNIDPESIKDLIGRKTKAILPVHFAGLPADMEEIHKLARERGLVVIEDACHALGSEYQGSKIGSCRYSDMAVFSFHPVKIITTGEGGCVTTNNKKYYERLSTLRHHGIYTDPALQEKLGGWFYQMKELGYNYRITDIQCALGQGQLKKLEHFLDRRQTIAERYNQAFSDLRDKVKLPTSYPTDRSHAWHLYLFRIIMEKAEWYRKKLFEDLHRRGINCQVHYIPVYQQPFYQARVTQGKNSCPRAEKYYKETLSLPIFPGLSEEETGKVIRVIREFFKDVRHEVMLTSVR